MYAPAPHFPESPESADLRQGFMTHAAYRNTGGIVEHVGGNFCEAIIRLPFADHTKNTANVMFGGALFSAADPFFMVLLRHRLGPNFTVWDVQASTKFLKTAQCDLFMHILIPEAERDSIVSAMGGQRKTRRHYNARWLDASGIAYCSIDKEVYIRRCPPPVSS